MDVILLERIEKLGQMGDVVSVKSGYARNYLLPQKKALRATDANKAAFEGQRAHLEAANVERRTEAEGIAGRMQGVSVILVRQASENQQLYGSVTSRDVKKALEEAGYTVDHTQVVLDRPIKTLGLHEIRIRLHPEVTITVTANVARTPEEADLQARGIAIGTLDEEDEDEVQAEAAEFFDEPPAPGEAEAEAEAPAAADDEADRNA